MLINNKNEIYIVIEKEEPQFGGRVLAYSPEVLSIMAFGCEILNNVPLELDSENPRKLIAKKESNRLKFSDEDGVLEFKAFAFGEINNIPMIYAIVSKDNLKCADDCELMNIIRKYCNENSSHLFYKLDDVMTYE